MKVSRPFALAAIIASFGVLQAHATTWFPKTVPDPFAAGKECKVAEWGSYGGYIYSWPSKYDQVFWPYTDDAGIWYCESSGFAAFVHDFDKLKEGERAAIAAFLKEHPGAVAPGADRLKRIEALYALREEDAQFRVFLLRLLAYKYEDLGDLDAAKAYRTRAFAAMQDALAAGVDEKTRLEYLYVCANYARKLGQPGKSDEYLEQLHAAASKAQPESRSYADYLEKLAVETPNIGPDGKLAPGPKER
jgi:hypothetical protein